MAWTETTRGHYERRCARYASDLTDEEWVQIEPLMPSPNRMGRPRKTDLREVVNALLYMASSGGAWRLLLNQAKDAALAWKAALNPIIGVVSRLVDRIGPLNFGFGLMAALIGGKLLAGLWLLVSTQN